MVSFKSLNLQFTPVTSPPPLQFLLKNPGQSLNFSDCTLMLKFSMFFNPLYLLQLSSWIQRLSQTLVQSLWHYYRQCCILSIRRCITGFLSFWMLVVGLSADLLICWWLQNSTFCYFSFISWNTFLEMLSLVTCLVIQRYSSHRKGRIHVWFFAFITFHGGKLVPYYPLRGSSIF